MNLNIRYIHIVKFTLVFLTLFGFSSCKLLFPNFLFRENKEIIYYELQEIEEQAQLVMPGDRIAFSLYTRNGSELVDPTENQAGSNTGGGGGSRGTNSGTANAIFSQSGYIVRSDGYAELPVLGDVYVQGRTRLDLENYLEDMFSVHYNDPFILLQVTNRRAYVFMGLGGASIVSLPTENTTLIEVIALSGGIPTGAKSHKIRVIRGSYDEPKIKKIDLSTIDGLKDADFVIQPNDLIIVDPTTKVVPAILGEITPVLALLTTGFTIYLLFQRTN